MALAARNARRNAGSSPQAGLRGAIVLPHIPPSKLFTPPSDVPPDLQPRRQERHVTGARPRWQQPHALWASGGATATLRGRLRHRRLRSATLRPPPVLPPPFLQRPHSLVPAPLRRRSTRHSRPFSATPHVYEKRARGAPLPCVCSRAVTVGQVCWIVQRSALHPLQRVGPCCVLPPDLAGHSRHRAASPPCRPYPPCRPCRSTNHPRCRGEAPLCA